MIPSIHQPHHSLLKTLDLGNDPLQEPWRTRGLVPTLKGQENEFVSNTQLTRFQTLADTAKRLAVKNPRPTSLFESSDDIFLGRETLVSQGLIDISNAHSTENLLAQLLPYWIEQTERIPVEPSTWLQVALGALEVSSGNQGLIERIRLAQARTDALAGSRVTQFSRSAHYMGSKAGLAPFLSEILQTFLAPESVILDLMCGSGAAASSFCRSWRTIASDAQQFSRLLAKVQGGGMTAERAARIADSVLSDARKHFEELPAFIKTNVLLENDFLSSELSGQVLKKLLEWVKAYPRIGNLNSSTPSPFSDSVELRRIDKSARPYILFSAYYGNLFFGVRQAAEIDCLRHSIEQLTDPLDKDWALGALVCAVSSCAYSYGGHFAQPKSDGTDRDRFEALAPDMLVSRGLSVSHEFFVRLTSLGAESEQVAFDIESVPGPWEAAMPAAASAIGQAPACVYFDPPYTRDEYSRYYHVLETLVRYDYPVVKDKPSIPRRGDGGRFASAFATRSTSQIEQLLADIINQSLEHNWKCLWSYSDTGAATIERVLTKVTPRSASIDIFCMDHVYKAQGKHRAKTVKEYAILLSP